jgi:hypothetical protein
MCRSMATSGRPTLELNFATRFVVLEIGEADVLHQAKAEG